MLDERITPVDEGRDHLLVPDEKAPITGIGVEHKAQADIVAFALHAVDPAASAPEAYPFGAPYTDAIDRLIGPGGQRLRHGRIDVVGNPGDAGTFGMLVQFVFRKVMLLAQVRERLRAFLLVRARDASRLGPGGIVAHPLE